MDLLTQPQQTNPPLYILAGKASHSRPTIVHISRTLSIGGGGFTLIAGPCSIESREQIIGTAMAVKAAGAHILRGGAFKPRSSPYAFQGIGKQGLKVLPVLRGGE
jgi:3-deoxy-7-phosphoheptulonate synthase